MFRRLLSLFAAYRRNVISLDADVLAGDVGEFIEPIGCLGLGVSLVKYCVPFCNVTTVCVEQPAISRKVSATSGRPKFFMFITLTFNPEKSRA